MVIKLFYVLFILVSFKAFSAPLPVSPKKASSGAGEQFKAFYAQKNYAGMSRLFLSNSKAAFFRSSPEIIAMTTEALEARKLYLAAGTFKLSLIRIQYPKENSFITNQIKQKKPLDGQTYPPALLNLYFDLYKDLSNYILTTDADKLNERILPNYNLVKTILQKLEHEEGKVDKQSELVEKHLNSVEKQKYTFTKSLSMKMVSWQMKSVFLVSTVQKDVIITNTGLCLGGDAGYENINYRFFASACALIGQGVVQAEQGLTYRQSGLPAQGLIAALGASMKVSSSGSELGLSVPFMMSNQKLTEPPASAPECSAGCSVEALSTLNYGLVIQGKWNFETLYFLTEYGRYFKNDSSLWAIGIGYSL